MSDSLYPYMTILALVLSGLAIRMSYRTHDAMEHSSQRHVAAPKGKETFDNATMQDLCRSRRPPSFCL